MLERRKRISHREEFKKLLCTFFFLFHINSRSRHCVSCRKSNTCAIWRKKLSAWKMKTIQKLCEGEEHFISTFLSSTLTRIAGRFYRQKRQKKLFNSFILANCKWKLISKIKNGKLKRDTKFISIYISYQVQQNIKNLEF